MTADMCVAELESSYCQLVTEIENGWREENKETIIELHPHHFQVYRVSKVPFIFLQTLEVERVEVYLSAIFWQFCDYWNEKLTCDSFKNVTTKLWLHKFKVVRNSLNFIIVWLLLTLSELVVNLFTLKHIHFRVHTHPKRFANSLTETISDLYSSFLDLAVISYSAKIVLCTSKSWALPKLKYFISWESFQRMQA